MIETDKWVWDQERKWLLSIEKPPFEYVSSMQKFEKVQPV